MRHLLLIALAFTFLACTSKDDVEKDIEIIFTSDTVDVLQSWEYTFIKGTYLNGKSLIDLTKDSDNILRISITVINKSTARYKVIEVIENGLKRYNFKDRPSPDVDYFVIDENGYLGLYKDNGDLIGKATLTFPL